MNTEQLIAAQLKATRLEILVFGPAVAPRAEDVVTASLQDKRTEMKEALTAAGHSVSFGEDVVDLTLPSPLSDPLIQEVAAMAAADLIIVLVSSPGSIAEATIITTKRDLCTKAAFYCLEEHRRGLVVRHLEACQHFGASCSVVTRESVERCDLMGEVLDKVGAVHVGKALLF